MLPNRQMPPATNVQDNPLWVSWHDTNLLAGLNPQTVMEYFCRKSNPFYDRVCNNETIRMQRLSLEHLNNMVGIEYILLHVAEPILYVIRKQHRHSPTEATPIADYYIIAGVVYKAPDLASVINSRILGTVVNLEAAFEEASSYSRFHVNRGYTWDFSANKAMSDKSKAAAKKDNSANKDEGSTVFQMQRVDMLLAELLRKFPPPIPPIVQQQIMQPQLQSTQDSEMGANNGNPGNAAETSPSTSVQPSGGVDIKTEIAADMKPPPEKKVKL